MATIVTRAGKGSPLTHNEVDANFVNLNTDKAETASPAFTGQVSIPDGTAAAPALTNTGDTDTGLYFPAANQVAVSLGGVQKAIMNADETTFKTRFVVDCATGSQLSLVGNNYANGYAALAMSADGVFDITPLNSSFGYGTLSLSGRLQVSGSVGTSGQALISGGSGTAPAWGTLPLSGGGTGATTGAGAFANLMGYTSTATSGGATNLSNTSTQYQLFTGTAVQTVRLPTTSTLTTGWTFHIVNNSTANLTVNATGSSYVCTVTPQTTAMVTCISTSVSDSTAWEYGFTAFGAGTSGQVLTAAGSGYAPSWADVGTAIAALAAGAVGSYMFARANSASGDAAFNATRAGSDLVPTSAICSVTGAAANVSMASAAVQSGTWRAMGYYDYFTPNGTSGNSFGATLWLRIS